MVLSYLHFKKFCHEVTQDVMKSTAWRIAVLNVNEKFAALEALH